MGDDIVERFSALISPLAEQIKELYLFGSRCRDGWRPDSDYDTFIIREKMDRAVIDRLYDVVMEILLDTGRLISLKIFAEAEFNRLKAIPTPFMRNVMTEGRRLGIHN